VLCINARARVLVCSASASYWHGRPFLSSLILTFYLHASFPSLINLLSTRVARFRSRSFSPFSGPIDVETSHKALISKRHSPSNSLQTRSQRNSERAMTRAEHGERERGQLPTLDTDRRGYSCGLELEGARGAGVYSYNDRSSVRGGSRL
jgi:hypothetical protein